jgi:glycosyltransferase involved in cell wall biosynthesis
MLQEMRLEFVIPVFNEEECLDELMNRLAELRRQSQSLRIEAIFVDDGSTDGSLGKLTAAADQHDFFKVVSLSRNFGHQTAVTAGLDVSTADVVAIVDADLQDPPELVLDMYERMAEGYEVVYGQRTQRRGESLYKRITANIFYRFMSALCDTEIPRDTGDFRLMSRRVVEAVGRMPERHRFLRGMVPWVGFRSVAFPYVREPRFKGETKYPTRKMLRFAVDASLSFSPALLGVAVYAGVLIAAAGALAGAVLTYVRLFTPYAVPGITAVIVAMVILSGIQILMLGVTGAYIGRLFEESKRRPLYFIDRTWNLNRDNQKV